MVPDKYISWHAGISSWKKIKKLNKYSIGIEIHNPGHQYGYKYFNKRQLNSIKYLSLKLKKNIKLKRKPFRTLRYFFQIEKKIQVKNFHGKIYQNIKIGIWHSLIKDSFKKIQI